MNTSITPSVSPPPPLTLGDHEVARVREPLAARRPTPPAPGAAVEELARALESIEMEDGGVALALDLSDDLAPHWLAWMEWVDAGERDQRYGQLVDHDHVVDHR
jgi:hypothetical protein